MSKSAMLVLDYLFYWYDKNAIDNTEQASYKKSYLLRIRNTVAFYQYYRSTAARSQFCGGTVSIWFNSVSIFVDAEKWKSGASAGPKVDRCPGPRTKVQAIPREAISKKKKKLLE